MEIKLWSSYRKINLKPWQVYFCMESYSQTQLPYLITSWGKVNTDIRAVLWVFTWTFTLFASLKSQTHTHTNEALLHYKLRQDTNIQFQFDQLLIILNTNRKQCMRPTRFWVVVASFLKSMYVYFWRICIMGIMVGIAISRSFCRFYIHSSRTKKH